MTYKCTIVYSTGIVCSIVAIFPVVKFVGSENACTNILHMNRAKLMHRNLKV